MYILIYFLIELFVLLFFAGVLHIFEIGVLSAIHDLALTFNCDLFTVNYVYDVRFSFFHIDLQFLQYHVWKRPVFLH